MRGGTTSQWLLEKNVITGTMNTTSIALALNARQVLPKTGNLTTLRAVEKLGETKNAPAGAKRNTSVAMVNDIASSISNTSNSA